MNTFGMMMDKYVQEMEARIAKLESIALERESDSGNSVQKSMDDKNGIGEVSRSLL